MDELLINACLEERQPLSLPWGTGAEKKSEVNTSNDGAQTQLNKEVSQDNDIIKELEEKYESRYCTRPRYGDVNSYETGKGPYWEKMNSLKYENKDKTEAQINIMCEPCLGVASREYDLRSSTKYRGINSTSKRVYDVMGDQKHNPAAEYVSAYDTKMQRSGFKSPRGPLKISRKMVQESKSGFPLPPIAECSLQERKEQMSMSLCSVLRIQNGSDTSQIYGAVKYGTKSRVPNDSNTAASFSYVNRKNKDNNVNLNQYDSFKTLDLDVDNELDNLLEETADAINYKCSKKDEEKEHKSQGVNTDKINDYKKANSSVSKYEDSGDNIDGKDRWDKLAENGNKPKSVRERLLDEMLVKKHICSDESNKDEMIEVRHGEVKTNKNADENMTDKRNKHWYKKEEQRDVKKIMDTIDGIEVEVFAKKLKGHNREETKTKQNTMSKSSKSNLDVKCLDTDTDSRSKRKTQRKISKSEKTKVNRSNDLRDGQPTREPLMDQKDTEYDVFDISPVKNRETISDLEDDDGKIVDKSKGKKTVESKTKRLQIPKKDNVNVMSNVKLAEEESPKVSSKRRKKKTKMDAGHETNVRGNINVEGFSNEKQLVCQKKVKTEILDSENYPKGPKLLTKKISKNKEKNENSSKTTDSQSVNDTLASKRKQKRRVEKDHYNLENRSFIKSAFNNAVDGENESLKNRPKPSTSYTIIKHDKTPDIHSTDSVVKSTLVIKDTGTEIDNGDTWRKENISTCDIDNDSKVSMNPHKRAIQQQTIPVNAIKYNDRIAISNDNQLRKVNTEHYEIFSRSKKVYVGDVEQSAEANVCMTLENTKKTPEVDLGELMYDSDTDTDIISDLMYQQYLIYRSPSEESKEFEFPRPASNRTFIIDSDNDDCDENCVHGNISVPRNDGANKELPDNGEKKLSKMQRFVNFITSCFKSKTDN